ncbi:hypothetical protein [Chryseobacterium jejuense]|uniref:hypothetical protein n=1 Tax=Chryseobacterium jejuense TaxID=445960 RepID=UPI001AE99EC2|nr:hypothetical protein [Chryseobacterium jejuense]MBP2616640.1 hypothetical protein [Chryseobacterium jejuense]
MRIKRLNFLTLLLLGFFTFSCQAQSNTDCLTKLEDRLTPKINKENKVGEILNVRDEANCFDWDTLIVQMAINPKEMTEQALGIKISQNYDYSLESDNTAMLLFLKNNNVVHYILQKPTVDKEIFDSATSIKAYHFLKLVNNFGDNAYAKIPKEKAVFETYQIYYHNAQGQKINNPKFGLGVRVKD